MLCRFNQQDQFDRFGLAKQLLVLDNVIIITF